MDSRTARFGSWRERFREYGMITEETVTQAKADAKELWGFVDGQYCSHSRATRALKGIESYIALLEADRLLSTRSDRTEEE